MSIPSRMMRFARLNLLSQYYEITIQYCADKAGISESRMRQIFHGSGLTTTHIQTIADIFNVPVEWILYGENDSPEILPFLPEVSHDLHEIRTYLGYSELDIQHLTSISSERIVQIERQRFNAKDPRGYPTEECLYTEDWPGCWKRHHECIFPNIHWKTLKKSELLELLDLYGVSYDDIIYGNYLTSDLDIWKIPNYYTNMTTGKISTHRRHLAAIYLGNKIHQRRLEMGLSSYTICKKLHIPLSSAQHLDVIFKPDTESSKNNAILSLLSLDPVQFYDLHGIDEWLKINL